MTDGLFKYIILLACLLALPVQAAEAPVPSSHPLKTVEKKLESEKQREAELQKQMKGLKATLDKTRTEMVGLAKNIKSNEQDLTRLEREIAALQKEGAELSQRLAADKGSMASLMLALARLERVPTEALLARPGAPLQTAQTAMLLQSTLPRLYGRARELNDDLTRLAMVLDDLETKRAKAHGTAQSLKSKQTEMAGLLSERERLLSQTQTDHGRHAEAIKALSREAGNLRDLVTKLEQREKEMREAAVSQPAVRASRATPLPKAGSAQLPLSGIIRIGYGETDDIGASSQGLTIDGREGGLVVAPMGGVVQYAGEFRNYGQLVIVEHEGGYHSLIAGLARIDTVVGQSVTGGEPLGLMGSGAENGSKPSLYYELRHNGQPVNPSRKFAGL